MGKSYNFSVYGCQVVYLLNENFLGSEFRSISFSTDSDIGNSFINIFSFFIESIACGFC